MARIKKNEKYVKNAAESLAKMVTDSASYQLFIEQLKLLFEGNEITLEGKEEIKRNIIKTYLCFNGIIWKKRCGAVE